LKEKSWVISDSEPRAGSPQRVSEVRRGRTWGKTPVWGSHLGLGGFERPRGRVRGWSSSREGGLGRQNAVAPHIPPLPPPSPSFLSPSTSPYGVEPPQPPRWWGEKLKRPWFLSNN